MDTAAMGIGVQVIEANGLFDISCCKWRVKTKASRTISAFKSHFRLTEIEYNFTVTASSAGYYAANAAAYKKATTPTPDFIHPIQFLAASCLISQACP